MKNLIISPTRLKNIGLTAISAFLMALPVQAAEKINFLYGPFLVSLKVDSLDIFAKENIVNSELAFYLNFANVDEAGKQRLREILSKKAELDPLVIYRFVKTPIGETFLEQLGKVINIPGGRNGKYSIRGAIIQAALSEEGLSVLTFLQNYSTAPVFSHSSAFLIVLYNLFYVRVSIRVKTRREQTSEAWDECVPR